MERLVWARVQGHPWWPGSAKPTSSEKLEVDFADGTFELLKPGAVQDFFEGFEEKVSQPNQSAELRAAITAMVGRWNKSHPHNPIEPPEEAQQPVNDFREMDFDCIGKYEIEEDDGMWSEAQIYRHKTAKHVVLWFPGNDQYEGLDSSYRFSGGVLQDGDGEEIKCKFVGKVLTRTRMDTPRGPRTAAVQPEESAPQAKKPKVEGSTLTKTSRTQATLQARADSDEDEEDEEDEEENGSAEEEDDDDFEQVQEPAVSSRKRTRGSRRNQQEDDEDDEEEDGNLAARSREAEAQLAAEEQRVQRETQARQREERANGLNLLQHMRDVEDRFESHGPPEPVPQVQTTSANEDDTACGMLKTNGFWGNVAKRAASGDEDLECLGASGPISLVDFPHSREDCLMYRFAATDHAQHCPKCYCYVCDKAAADCHNWRVHCNATRADPKWQAARRAAKQQNAAGQAAQDMEEMEEEQEAQFIPQYDEQEGNADRGDDETEVKSLWSEYKSAHDYGGNEHPDSVVETTSLSYVKIPEFNHKRADHAEADANPIVFERESVMSAADFNSSLSNIQLETVWYAMVRHEEMLPNETERAGYFIGDGAGVGKGRMLAALILENWLRGRRRSLWVSTSPDLLQDTIRDLRDVGALVDSGDGRGAIGSGRVEVQVVPLNKLSYDTLTEDAVIFSTYQSLIGKQGKTGTKTRMDQLVKWLENGEETGVIAFDEAHKAKNLIPSAGKGGKGGKSKNSGTKTGKAVLEIQQRLPLARVVYCSATGASAVKHLCYMDRIGLWGPGTAFDAQNCPDARTDRQSEDEDGEAIMAGRKRDDFNLFAKNIEPKKSQNQDQSAMELVALDMKQRGMYQSRQLSFSGAEFETLKIELTPEQKNLYDNATRYWQLMMSAFETATDLKGKHWRDDSRGKKLSYKGVFWGAHQRFFKTLLVSMKIPEVTRMCQEALDSDHSVVIGIQSTGESRLDAFVKDDTLDLDEFVALRQIIEGVLKYYPKSPNFDEKRAQKKTQQSGREQLGRGQRRARQKRRRSYREIDSDEEEEEYDDDDEEDEEAEEVDEENEDDGGNGGLSGHDLLVQQTIDDFADNLYDELDSLALPKDHPLDQLINALGGPSQVAEMTGRKGMVVDGDDGKEYLKRSKEAGTTGDKVNLAQRNAFQEGEKRGVCHENAAELIIVCVSCHHLGSCQLRYQLAS